MFNFKSRAPYVQARRTGFGHFSFHSLLRTNYKFVSPILKLFSRRILGTHVFAPNMSDTDIYVKHLVQGSDPVRAFVRACACVCVRVCACLCSVCSVSKQVHVHLNMDTSFLNKCPKPSYQAFRTLKKGRKKRTI